MSGIGALFELYTVYKETRGDKDKEKEEPKLEPDPEESVEGYVDAESEWHYVIENENWDDLLDMIQNYDFQKFKPKEPDKKKKKRLRVVGAAMWVKDKVLPSKPPEEIPPSPLLAMNEKGETPLHVAVKRMTPDKYVIRMVFCEKRAALIADGEGKLPLHWSCICERNKEVIDRLIRANFHHMQREDNAGNTALCYAVMKAAEKEDFEGNPDCYWGIPRTQEEKEWQERREQTWAKARFILLSYSTRRKVFVEAERDLLLQALEHAAPPGLIEVCILGAQGMLHTDKTLATTALRWFLRRKYPIKNLQLLLHHFPDEDVECLEGARKILTEYYYEGCREDPSRQRTFREEMEKHALDSSYKRSLPCQEWWSKIQCLLRLCGHRNDKDKKKEFDNKYLLHAALSNSDTPPSLVQLLMVMNPEVIRLPHPFNQSLLVHLICYYWKYNLYPHSKKVGIQIDLEEPPMEQVLKIVLASDPTLTRKRHRSRLPLHDAVATSKSIEFLDVLVQKDRKSLAVRDPQTKLYPFQIAALRNLNKNAALWAHARYTPDGWKNLEPEERAKAVDEVIEGQQVEQLNTIFYLLRQFPAAVEPSATLRKAHGFRDSHGKGMVSAHYMLLMYARGEDSDQMLLKENLALVYEAINEGKIPADLDQWWSKLKFWIRYCYAGDQSLPSGEEFLLHAAVANADVPPLIIELLLAIFPSSASLPVHGDTEYPLHIAAATPQYEPLPFEVIEVKSVIGMLVDAHPEAARIQSPSGSPLDIALANGTRSDDEIQILGGNVALAVWEENEEDIDLMVETNVKKEEEQEEDIDLMEENEDIVVEYDHGDEGTIGDSSIQNSNLSSEPPAAETRTERPDDDAILERHVVKLQSFVRGSIARSQVSDMVDNLINQMEAEMEGN